MTLYGALPADLGHIDLSPTEMLFWMYCPIFVPRAPGIVIPPNLEQFRPIVEAVLIDLEEQGTFYYDDDLHIYLTAKTLWVEGRYIGNRPGWHSDGYGTDDLNYIWCDRAPTHFVQGEFTLDENCQVSMWQMQQYGKAGKIITYPDKHLLRLDQRVIHQSPDAFAEGMRTFVKVSVSKDRYDLVGNSINHALPASHWPMVERKLDRNHPQSRIN